MQRRVRATRLGSGFRQNRSDCGSRWHRSTVRLPLRFARRLQNRHRKTNGPQPASIDRSGRCRASSGKPRQPCEPLEFRPAFERCRIRSAGRMRRPRPGSNLVDAHPRSLGVIGPRRPIQEQVEEHIGVQKVVLHPYLPVRWSAIHFSIVSSAGSDPVPAAMPRTRAPGTPFRADDPEATRISNSVSPIGTSDGNVIVSCRLLGTSAVIRSVTILNLLRRELFRHSTVSMRRPICFLCPPARGGCKRILG